MSKSRIIYIGVFVVSVAVLIWDRSTQSQSSMTQSVQPQRMLIMDKKNINPQSDWDLTPSVLNILSQNSSNNGHWQDEPDGPHRNLFTLSEQFHELIKIDPAPQNRLTPQGTRKDEFLDTVELAKQLRLTSILIGPNQNYVVINGQVVFVGQNIGPFRLNRIYEEAVQLQRGNRLILLSMK